MPCGDKWKNKTMRRMPMGRGIGNLQGHCFGEHHWDSDRYAVYNPGCQPVVAPGVRWSWDAGSRGVYMPHSICGAVPAPSPGQPEPPPCEPMAWRDNPATEQAPPWWHKAGHCCESCAYGHPCEGGCPGQKKACCSSCAQGGPCVGGCGDACTCGKEGRHATKPKRKRKAKTRVRALKRALRPGRGAPRNGIGGGMSGCGGGCDPSMGQNPGSTGCAPGTRPHGMYWGYQRHHRRWPATHRSAPYPIPQRPYPIGLDIAQINEPFQGCPTRAAYYYWDPTCQ